MTQPLVIIVLLGLIALIAGESVLYWHRQTKGTWKKWPAGRSLMWLLVIITVGFGYGVLNQFLGQYALRPLVSLVLYAAFIAALIKIRLTIRSEMRAGKRRLLEKNRNHTGPVNVIVADKNEEEPHE